MGSEIKQALPRRLSATRLALAASLCAAAASSCAASAIAQEPPPRAELKRALLTFELTLSNPTDTPRRAVGVGVTSRVRSGEFDCKSTTQALLPLADYVVRFYVWSAETIIPADPPLVLPPKGFTRFTVSLVPNVTGACGFWSADVAPVAVLDEGTKMVGKADLITSADLNAFNRRKPEEDEILRALQHRNEAVRTQAVRQMLESKIEIETLRVLLEAKLDDPSAAVRITATRAVGKLELKSLAGKVVSRLRGTRSGPEAAAYCEALGRLKHPGTIDGLVAVLTDTNSSAVADAARALVELQHPDVPLKVRPLLSRHIAWSLPGATTAAAESFAAACSVLIKYRDMQSVPALSRVVARERSGPVVLRLLLELLDSTDRERLVKDPFIRALAPALTDALGHQDEEVRVKVIELLCRIQPKQETLREALRRGLGDKEVAVRMLAAHWVARLEYKSLADELIGLLRTSRTDEERNGYCDALTRLKVSCK